MEKQKYLTIGAILFLLGLLLIPVFLVKRKMKISKPAVTKSEIIRPAAVAGSFYPADPKELESQITTLINQSEKIAVPGRMRILIVPHAGTVFSGPTAAAGFKQIEKENYTRVIILGASHRAWFEHAAVFDQGVWETPLGKTTIDENLASAIISQDQKILADLNPHQDEHSLEIELIFLQKVLKDFKILPILLSQTTEQLAEALAQKIAQNLDDQTLLVISTDLSHYPPYEIANKVDGKTIAAILSGQTEKFNQTIAELKTAGYSGLETAACGQEALRVALKVGEILGINFQKIKYENSGDSPEAELSDKNRVVGYVAIGGWSEKLPAGKNQLDQPTQKEALNIARKTLTEYLTSNKIPDFTPQNPGLSQSLGCFVTLRNQGELRGCIGEFEPEEPLYKVIQRMAIAAATKDSRFPPVKADELKEIKIEISVMSPKKKVNDWQEIQLGKQGVMIQKGLRSGTFLPQVATETGWTKEEFLAQLCSQKAGLPADCYQDPEVNLYTFETQVFEEE